jgi:mersacidin/lichenicidin family type 2 lantibiotic
MSKQNIIRAWKDAEYRNSLSAAEQAALPDNPAGAIELTLAELEAVTGGSNTSYPDISSHSCCWMK